MITVHFVRMCDVCVHAHLSSHWSRGSNRAKYRQRSQASNRDAWHLSRCPKSCGPCWVHGGPRRRIGMLGTFLVVLKAAARAAFIWCQSHLLLGKARAVGGAAGLLASLQQLRRRLSGVGPGSPGHAPDADDAAEPAVASDSVWLLPGAQALACSLPLARSTRAQPPCLLCIAAAVCTLTRLPVQGRVPSGVARHAGGAAPGDTPGVLT